MAGRLYWRGAAQSPVKDHIFSPEKKKFQLDGWRALYLFLDLLESLSYFISVVVFCMGQITTRPISGPFSLSLFLLLSFSKKSRPCAFLFGLKKHGFIEENARGCRGFKSQQNGSEIYALVQPTVVSPNRPT